VRINAPKKALRIDTSLEQEKFHFNGFIWKYGYNEVGRETNIENQNI